MRCKEDTKVKNKSVIRCTLQTGHIGQHYNGQTVNAGGNSVPGGAGLAW